MENDNVKLKGKMAAIILVNYKDYAEKYLTECAESLRKQDYKGEMKFFITDNESAAKSRELIKNISPEAELIINENNDGFAKGNNDAIKLALKQGYEYIILFNMDTVVEKDCVRKMVEAADRPRPACLASESVAGRPNSLSASGRTGFREEREQVGAAQARLMLWPEKDKINSLGNVTHFLGFGYAEGYGEEYETPHPNPLLRKEREICYPSGAAVLYKAEALKKVGLFDEELWMYNEDQDLGWRLWLAGYKCVLASGAVVYHKYEFSRSIKKFYWLDRNRIIVMLKNYRLATLLLILPAFLIMEIGLAFFSIKGGWFKEKLKVYKYFVHLKNWRYILKARHESQILRQVSDREITELFSGKIWYQEIGDSKLIAANIFFNAYWKIIRNLIWW